MKAAIEQAEDKRRYADKVAEQAEGANQLRRDRPGLLPAVLGQVLPVPERRRRAEAEFTGMVMVDMWIFKARYNEQREVEFARIGSEITR